MEQWCLWVFSKGQHGFHGTVVDLCGRLCGSGTLSFRAKMHWCFIMLPESPIPLSQGIQLKSLRAYTCRASGLGTDTSFFGAGHMFGVMLAKVLLKGSKLELEIVTYSTVKKLKWWDEV